MKTYYTRWELKMTGKERKRDVAPASASYIAALSS
jgi:hypothetical protein